jgi:hypothetical protein
MAMYVGELSDIKLSPIESLHAGTTLSGALTGAPSFAPALTSTVGRLNVLLQYPALSATKQR